MESSSPLSIVFLVSITAIYCATARPLSSSTSPQLMIQHTQYSQNLMNVTTADGHCSSEEETRLTMEASSSSSSMMMMMRRSLRGPGSSPPRCYGKCGQCSPCRPVHVSVPPGTPVTAEYYPEAWRCKCGSKLYMP